MVEKNADDLILYLGAYADFIAYLADHAHLVYSLHVLQRS